MFRILKLSTALFLFLPTAGCDDDMSTGEVVTYLGAEPTFPLANPSQDDGAIESITVGITGITAHHEVLGWVPLFEGTKIVDLMDLDTLPMSLSTEIVPEGFYDEVRLTVSMATIVIDGMPETLSIGSGDVAGSYVRSNFCMSPNTLQRLELGWQIEDNLHHEDDLGYWLDPRLSIIRAPSCDGD